MKFKIWDNHFGGYMRDLGGEVVFDKKLDADKSIRDFIQDEDRQDEWICRLDVHHIEANLSYHLMGKLSRDDLELFKPRLLPINFDVPTTHWKLLSEKDHTEVAVGSGVTCSRGYKYVIEAMQPPHKMAAEGRVYVRGANGETRSFYASVFGCKYRYQPPYRPLLAKGLRWGASKYVERMEANPAARGTLLLPPNPVREGWCRPPARRLGQTCRGRRSSDTNTPASSGDTSMQPGAASLA